MTSKLNRTTKPDSSSPAPNAFIGHKEKPNESKLAGALGAAKLAWDQLLIDLAEQNGVNTHEWKCYSAKWGWSLRALRGK